MAAASPDKRVLILTSTKALQDQVAGEFGQALGAAVVKGMGAYLCTLPGMPPKTTAAEGPCRAGASCELKAKGCPYFDARRRAKEARVVLSNYHQWFALGDAARRAGPDAEPPFGEIDLLVADEAHHAPSLVADAMTAEVREDSFEAVLGREMLDPGEDADEWRDWAGLCRALIAPARKDAAEGAKAGDKASLRRVAQCLDLEQAFDRLSFCGPSWVQAREAVYSWPRTHVRRFGPSKLRREDTERWLLQDVPGALLVSATITPDTPELLGLEDWEFSYQDFPSSFPPERRPVVSVPGVTINRNTTERTLRTAWVAAIDKVARARADRKGIVHAHSYKRAAIYAEETKLGSRVIAHEPGAKALAAAVARFKAAGPGAVLVSPVLTTGYDFPGDQCEFQVIAKLPWPNLGDPIFAARLKRSPKLGDYLAAQNLIQACGRGMRSADDLCETFVVDEAATRWIQRNKKCLPSWFLSAWRRAYALPEALPKL